MGEEVPWSTKRPFCQHRRSSDTKGLLNGIGGSLADTGVSLADVGHSGRYRCPIDIQGPPADTGGPLAYIGGLLADTTDPRTNERGLMSASGGPLANI